MGDVPIFFTNKVTKQVANNLQTMIFKDTKMLEPAKAFLKIAVVFRDKFYYSIQNTSNLKDKLDNKNLVFLNNHNKAQGITGDKQKESQAHFFLYFAKGWSSNNNEDYLRQQRNEDVHAPDHLRVNGNVVMLDDWYTLFGVRPTDKSYLKPEDRIIIW